MRNLTALMLSASLVPLAACAVFDGSRVTDAAAPWPSANHAASTAVAAEEIAPGAPGDAPTWVNAAKQGVGASYEAYFEGQYRDGGPTGPVSRVWFSIADGVLTETMYGLIHEAQIKQMRFAVVTETGLSVEGRDTTSRIEYLHVDAQGRPLSPAYRIVTRDNQNRFEIIKRIYSDPDSQSLVVRTSFRAMTGSATPYLLLEPHLANTGVNDSGMASVERLQAMEKDVAMVLRPSASFESASVGFVGVSDGLTDLADGRLDQTYASTGAASGNIMLTGRLPLIAEGQTLDRDFVIGFGRDAVTAESPADASLATGLDEVLARFNGEGQRVGWEDWLATLTELPRLAEQSTDGGKLAYASALMLKVQEDRTHAGALIASLSNPWGDTVDATNPSTGYKAVWPRDFYQVAMALMALGDTQTPVAAFRYLPQVQVDAETPGNTGATGWFLQKTHVDGQIEWVGVQLDQTAMPIMLGWRLWKAGEVSDAEIAEMYRRMIKPAADFLVTGGTIALDWNDRTVTPPWSQQERWEEQEGYSPSTTAAVITGLTVAAEMAHASGDATSADRYQAAADDYASKVESRMLTTEGTLGDGDYFLRLSRNENPNDHGPLGENNGQPALPEDQIVDGGFLELVRYGVRAADAPSITATLPEYDDEARAARLRVRYTLDGVPAFRRYGNDGYGENAETGGNYGVGGMTPGQRGRIWPIFTGERGHYEIALANATGARPAVYDRIRRTYAGGMEAMANEGLLLPEQVWDGVGDATPHGYRPGQGTNSATPLAWSHAEYLKLLRSLADRQVWDRYGPVADRYSR